MDEARILFHREAGGTLPEEKHFPHLARWIETIVADHGGRVGAVNYIFCGDDYLHELNVSYLQHDTLTDIITFPAAEFPEVAGDLFISTERVAENARELGESPTDELHRVMIHGILHLCGRGDKDPAAAAAMRVAEDGALSRRPVELC